jgi:toxin-antitoxin system PIN domain toxin
MIIPDANLLIYAHNEADPDHTASLAWWKSLLAGDDDVGIPVVVVLAFLRLTTSSRVLARPLSVEESARRVECWFASARVRLISPGPGHIASLLECLRVAGTGGTLTTDAHIAALAIEYSAEVHTSDLDFGRFPRVRWRNPLRKAAKR